MLNDLKDFEHIYIACGHTDLRYGIDGLAGVIRERFELDPYTGRTIFLFCGKRSDRIKALVWEGDGFLLLYTRDLPLTFLCSQDRILANYLSKPSEEYPHFCKWRDEFAPNSLAVPKYKI